MALSVLDSSALLPQRSALSTRFSQVHQSWTQYESFALCSLTSLLQVNHLIYWYKVILLQNFNVSISRMTVPFCLPTPYFDSKGFNMTTFMLTYPQIIARSVSGALPAYYPENIILKALINMYNSPTPQTERAALFTRTSTVTVPWREHGYEMPHWIWALCWDTGAARLCGNYNVMKKTAPHHGLSHLAPTSVFHNAGPQGVKCSEWSSPLDLICAPRCCQNDLAVTWWEVLNVTWAFPQQKVSRVAQ